MDSEAEKLRDEAGHYRDLQLKVTDERTQEALAQLIAETEDRLRQLDEEPTGDWLRQIATFANDR